MSEVFGFRFDPAFRVPLSLLGIRPATSRVRLEDDTFEADFGRFRLVTPWSNVTSAEVSGPYRAYRVIGPRMSLADKGFTFGSSTRGGVCVRFGEAVAITWGPPRVRHPGLTLTVEDPDGLAEAIGDRISAR